MARIKSPEKRNAILQAAVREIAEAGLGAPTAKIARRAGLAAGTLFTYFANKEKLLNELYLELKIERGMIEVTLGELESRSALRGLPAGFASAGMVAMQEAMMDFIAKEPKRREELIERGFQVFWRGLR
jgi:AcrR family transcriptional regulator